MSLSISLATAALVLLLTGAPHATGQIVDTRLLSFDSATITEGLATLRSRYLGESRRTDREHVGAVLRGPDGRFRFTHGVARAGQDQVSFRNAFPDHYVLVGFWHTHGAPGHHRELFSPGDAALVRDTGLPFYLIDPAGALRVLRPEDVGRGHAGTWSGTGSRLRPPAGASRGSLVADA